MLAVGHALTDDDLVFCDDAGQPLWGRHVTTRQLKPLLRDAGLPPIRFHDLRHTFATLQLAAGTNPKLVSEVLGRKEVAITLDRYSHALPTLQARAWPASTASWAARRAAGQRAAPTRSRLAVPGRIRDQIRDQTGAPRARKSPIRAWIGPVRARLVPHTGFPVKRLMRLSRGHPVHPRDA
jgi:Phage integrase family